MPYRSTDVWTWCVPAAVDAGDGMPAHESEVGDRDAGATPLASWVGRWVGEGGAIVHRGGIIHGRSACARAWAWEGATGAGSGQRSLRRGDRAVEGGGSGRLRFVGAGGEGEGAGEGVGALRDL